jgi:hypothetical protein
MIGSITGDLSVALLDQARDLMFLYPNSVRAFALFCALREVRSMFEDEQGIPMSEALEIDRLLLGPIRRLLEEGSFQRCEIPPEHVVEEVLMGLALLRG